MEVWRHNCLPSTFTLMLPILNSASPLNFAEIIPPKVPGSSPADMGILLPLITAGLPSILTFVDVSVAWLTCAVLGNGVGINGAGGAGTLQTSGKAKHIPPPLQLAGNI